MKRALIVANLAGFGSFLVDDMIMLKEKGYNIDYAANGKTFDWSDTKKKFDDLSVTFHQIDFDIREPISRNNLLAYKQIRNLLTSKRFDLVHCHTPIAGLITRLAANKYRKNGCKVIYTTHGFSYTYLSTKKEKTKYYSLEKILSHFCDAIITINKEDYLSAKTMSCKKVYMINGVGVDTNRFLSCKINKTEYRRSIGVSEDEIMILSVGELSKRKNHQIVIRALNNIPMKSKYVYVICGGSIGEGTKLELEKLAEQLNVRLLLLGFRNDIPEIMKCSDIGLIPSIREGLGLSGIQSLASGVPIVGSNVQGIKDYVIDGVTGYLCNPLDENNFMKGILKLLSLSDKEKNKMKNNCIQMAKEYDIKVSHKQREDIYNDLHL